MRETRFKDVCAYRWNGAVCGLPPKHRGDHVDVATLKKMPRTTGLRWLGRAEQVAAHVTQHHQGPGPIHPTKVLQSMRAARHSEGAVPKLSQFNGWLADHVTALVGTMWCAYAFVALAFFGLPAALEGPKAFVGWASSQFIQLVLLPIILVATNRQEERNKVKDEADHRSQSHLYEINDQQLALLQQIVQELELSHADQPKAKKR